MIEIVDIDGLKVPAEFLSLLYPRVTRSIHEFSEQEILLPKGPRENMFFRVDYMPFTRHIMDAMMSDYWRKVALVGPTQSGKSLLGNNIPMLYYLFEREEDIIVGIPHMDLAKGIWAEKIMPVILGTRYAELLPTSGAGARGGTPTAIQMKNGAWLRFMGAGGGDAQRSSHTARVVIMTEIDKMDNAGECSEEADPVSQICMRADAFEESKIIMECTVTTEMGRIWQEAMVMGSGGEIYVPCPKCGCFQTLVPGGIVFDEADVLQAESSAGYRCCRCDKIWSDSDRRQALRTPIVAHRGQEVADDGTVTGPLPPTRTFGLHWNVLYSAMQSLGKTAAQQWEANRSELKEIKKGLQQSKWALPWAEDALATDVLSYSYLRQRADNSGAVMRVVPDWADYLVGTVDVQKRWLYWHVDAWTREGSSQVVEYGVTDIVDESDNALVKALDQTWDIMNEGWPQVDDPDKIHVPRLCLLDTGYRFDLIGPWLRNRHQWFGVKGTGRGSKVRIVGGKTIFALPGILTVKLQADGLKLWFIEVDETKAIVHDRYFLPEGQSGYTEVPRDVTQGYLMSLTAEKRELVKGTDKTIWVKARRRNDYLDCRSYSVAGAMYLQQRTKVDDERIAAKVEANREVQRDDQQRQKRSYLIAPRQKVGGGWLDASGRFYD